MITAIDTNVIIDIFRDDPEFVQASTTAVRKCLENGRLVACEVVWAEVRALFPSQKQFHSRINELHIQLLPIDEAAATFAGETWKIYRARGGNRSRLLPDFLVGSHALMQSDRLLTRDSGFYRDYFKNLRIFSPVKS
jgi:predicted nucleic acid-binding protein